MGTHLLVTASVSTVNRTPRLASHLPLGPPYRESHAVTQPSAQYITTHHVAGIVDMTISTGEVQLTTFGPVELSTFFVQGLRTGVRKIYRNSFAVELGAVVGD